MASTRVLLVDDEAFARSAIRLLLSASPDLSVIGEAHNGEQALRLCRELSPDVVVLDLHLPDLSGAQVAWQLRAQHPGRPTPAILALTSLGIDESLDPALRAGVAGYVLKDSPDTLVAAVKAVALGSGWLDPAAVPRLIARVTPSEPALLQAPPDNPATGHVWIATLRVEGLVSHRDPAQLSLRRAMFAAIRGAAADSRLDWAALSVKDEDDGLTLFVPSDVPPMRLAGPFLDHIQDGLKAAGTIHSAAHRLRLRMALHHGLVTPDETGWTGRAINTSRELVNAGPLHEALRRKPDALLAVLASEAFHRTVLSPGHRSINTDAFRPVVLSTRDPNARRAWLYVPGKTTDTPVKRWPSLTQFMRAWS